MGRLNAVYATILVGIAAVAPESGAAGLERRPIPPQPPPRAPYTVHQGWPLHRPPRPVVVHRPSHYERVRIRVYLPPVVFGGVVVDDHRSYGDDRYYRDDRLYRDHRSSYYYYPRPYQRDRLTWLDGETLYREDGWTEFTLDCNARGEKLWFEVRDGRVRLDWAEVVFENGEVQVVDFSERSIGPGVYSLLQFRGDLRVDHVRMVAEAASREVRLILRMER
jgi:hypothetical protein